MATTARTIRLDSSLVESGVDTSALLDVFAIGARTGLLWSNPDRVLAGLGPHQRFAVDRPGGFAEIAELLGQFIRSDEFEKPGSGPVAFAAFPFDRLAEGEVIVPEVVLGSTRDDRWATVLLDERDADLDSSQVLKRVVSLATATMAPRPNDPEPTEMTLQAALAPEHWRDNIVGRVRDLIRNGALDKCVLARELTVTANNSFDPEAIMGRLSETFPQANVFSIDGFFGASPELLVARLDDVVQAHPLAGTLPRSNDVDLDRQRAAELMASEKNQWEHRITIDWLLDTLLPFCSYVDAEPEPSIMSLANVHHLGTRVEGRLSQPSASVLELVSALHPTPAVGGAPQADALALIEDVEEADRGRYGGPAGWLDANGNGEFAVSVRCAQYEASNQVRLFAGVGVVGDSDPQAELDETRAKFQAILGALIRP